MYQDKSIEILKYCEDKGVKASLVKADLSDPISVDTVLAGSTHSFLATNFHELFCAQAPTSVCGPASFEMGQRAGEQEFLQGKLWVDACKKHLLEMVIFSGLEDVAERTQGKLPHVYHFNFKGKVN